MNDTPTTAPSPSIENLINDRLQALVSSAAGCRRNITEAKTSTKRKYFERKFKKIQNDVVQMLAVSQRIKNTQSVSTEA